MANTEDFNIAYEYYERIDLAGDKSAVRDSYINLLSLAHGSVKAKTLCAQFIPKFFKHYPEDSEKAIDALMDLCEDEEMTIRTTTIKHFPTLVKECKEYTAKVTDVLTQLLQAEDAVELNTVRQSLMTVIRLDSRSALTMIFQGAMKTAEVRDKTIEFLVADFLPYRDEFFSKNPALEKQFSEELVKALDDVTGSAYTSLMSILTALRMYDRTQAKNRSELVASLVKSLPENHFNSSSEEAVRKVIALSKTIVSFLEAGGISSGGLFAFYVNRILPTFNQVPERIRTTLLRQFVDIIRLGNPEAKEMEPAIEPLRRLMLDAAPAEPAEPADSIDTSKVDFNRIEATCLSIYLIALKRSNVADGNDLTSRFRFLYKISQENISKLRNALQKYKQAENRDAVVIDKERKMESAIVVINNIYSCVKELIKPVRLRKEIDLHPSWKPVASSLPTTPAPTITPSAPTKNTKKPQQTQQQGHKRKSPDTSNDDTSTPAGILAKKHKILGSAAKPSIPAKHNTLSSLTKPNPSGAKLIQSVSAKVERALYIAPQVRAQVNATNAGGVMNANGVSRAGNSNPLGLGAGDKRSSNGRGRGGRKLRR